MTNPVGISFLMMIVAGGGGGELLDYLDTATYWKQQGVEEVSVATMSEQLQPDAPDAEPDEKRIAELIDQMGATDFGDREAASAKLAAIGEPALTQVKQAAESDDAEVALRAETLVTQITGTGARGDPAAVRRLMAIRTLGELGDDAAVETLTPLLESEAPFEAEYTERAIAAINGATIEFAGPTREQLDADLALLPANVGIVAQLTDISKRPISLDEAIGQVELPAEMADAKDQIKRQLTEMAARAATMFGNVRLEAITLAVSAPLDGQTGFVILIARGRYDHQKVTAQLRANARRTFEADGVTAFIPETDAGMIPVDAERFILAVAEDETTPLGLMAKAVSTGRGTLAENAAMSKLIAEVDKTGEMWAVSRLDDSYKVTPYLAAFDTAMLVGRAGDSGTTQLTLTATGSDAEQVTAAAETIQQLIAEGIEQFKQMAETPMGPMIKPYQSMLKAIEIGRDGAVMTLTADVPGNAAAMSLMPWFGLRAVPPPH